MRLSALTAFSQGRLLPPRFTGKQLKSMAACKTKYQSVSLTSPSTQCPKRYPPVLSQRSRSVPTAASHFPASVCARLGTSCFSFPTSFSTWQTLHSRGLTSSFPSHFPLASLPHGLASCQVLWKLKPGTIPYGYPCLPRAWSRCQGRVTNIGTLTGQPTVEK